MHNIDKLSEDPFEGWSHQTDINRDQLILTDILKRKTILSTIPCLTDLKLQKSSNHLTNSQLKLEPVRINHLFTFQQSKRGIRQKTQGFKQFYNDSISPLKKKLVEILYEEQQQTKNTPATIIQQSGQQNRSQLIIHKDQTQYQPRLKYNHIQKQIKTKPVCTLQKIKTKELFGNRMKQTQSKMYMKLNALQMLEDMKKNIFREAASIQNLASKDRILFENRLTFITKSHKEMFLKKQQIQQKQEKVNQKLKQTFFKFDMFDKDKQKKKQKTLRLDVLTQFIDRIKLANSPLRQSNKSQIKIKSSLKTIQKGATSRQDLQSSNNSHKRSPHRYKLTIN